MNYGPAFTLTYERPLKRARIEMEEPTAMDIDTRYKRKAAVLDEVIELTPMQIDVRPPFVFYPIPQLVRADANALDAMDN
jgi:hypothetical protein